MLRWVDDLKANLEARGWSPATIEGIRGSLRFFGAWLGKEDPRSVTLRTLREYLEYLTAEYRTKAGTRLCYGSVTGRMKAISIYFSFLAKQRFILFNPAWRLSPRPKKNPLPDYVASEEVVGQMLSRPCPEEHRGIRDQALLELCYSTGMRRKELALLELADVDLQERLVKVHHGKGGKERVVPFGKTAKGALERYLKITRSRWQKGSDLECPRFFLTDRGRGLSIDMVNEVVRKYRPDKRIHPHGLRHACALHMLKAGADIRYIQELLGHSDPRTTLIYTRLFPADLIALHDRHHPRERMHDYTEA